MDLIQKLEIRWNIKSILKRRSFLNWDEVREMIETRFVSIGSHTNNHKILTNLSDADVYDELIQSRNKLIYEKVVGNKFIPFSYPNGNHDNRIVDMVVSGGYHLAVTTQKRWNSASTPLFRLNRISIHQDISYSKELFGCRITNLI